jgi:hypothetical protein
MARRIILNPIQTPPTFVTTDAKTWPYQDKSGKRLVLDAAKIAKQHPKYKQDIVQILNFMRTSARSGNPIISPYSHYMPQAYKEDSFRAFQSRCRYACSAVLHYVGEATDWTIWLTAPIVGKASGVPGDEFYDIWAKKYPAAPDESEDAHYERFCNWSREHALLVSDMLRNHAITIGYEEEKNVLF